jgi:anti-anti-sigma factor
MVAESRRPPTFTGSETASPNAALFRRADPRGGHVIAQARSDEEWVGTVAVLRWSGAVDMLTAPQLREGITAVLAKQPSGLVVDLTDVDFLASAGMQVLVLTHNDVTPAIRFAVVADGPATSRPLEVTGLTDLIALFPTRDAALAHVSG